MIVNVMISLLLERKETFLFRTTWNRMAVYKIWPLALAGVAQWIEHQPVNQRVTGSIPSQGTCLGCGPGPRWGVHERQPHMDVSLPLFLPAYPSV